MQLHEHQTKDLLRRYGVPVPNGAVAATPEEARAVAARLSGDGFVVKAQIHAGGRVKAGGIKLVDTPREAADYAESVLGTHLVTARTDAAGQRVDAVLVEETCDVAAELYLSVSTDGTGRRAVLRASAAGAAGAAGAAELGDDARGTFGKTLRLAFYPSAGVSADGARGLASGLGLKGKRVGQLAELLGGLCTLLLERHATFVEIDPLVVTEGGDLVCIDGRIDLHEGDAGEPRSQAAASA